MDREEIKRARSAHKWYTYAEFAEVLREAGLKSMNARNYGNRETGKVKFALNEVPVVCGVLGWTLEEGLRYLL